MPDEESTRVKKKYKRVDVDALSGEGIYMYILYVYTCMTIDMLARDNLESGLLYGEIHYTYMCVYHSQAAFKSNPFFETKVLHGYICYAQISNSDRPRISLRKAWIGALCNNPMIVHTNLGFVCKVFIYNIHVYDYNC